jgi:pimeloyl-ACP methyl ester carboxylesterase
MKMADHVFAGTGRDAPVVLLPGLFAGGWIWQETWDYLVARGHAALSPADPLALAPGAPDSMVGLREQLHETLARYGAREWVLCGNSLGGLVALDYAAHFPGQVRAVVASGAPGLAGDMTLGIAHAGRKLTREVAHAIAGKLFYDRSRLRDEVIDRTYAALSKPRDLLNMVRLLKAARDYGAARILPAIRCKVLLLWGANDPVTPVGDWEENLHLLADARLRSIERCGHAPMIERPEEFNEALFGFLRELAEEAMAAPVLACAG